MTAWAAVGLVVLGVVEAFAAYATAFSAGWRRAGKDIERNGWGPW